MSLVPMLPSSLYLYYVQFTRYNCNKNDPQWEDTRNTATKNGPHDALCYKIRAMFHEIWQLERFQTQKWPSMSFKGIGNGAIR